VIEAKSEAEILAIDQLGDIGNCAVTEYRFDPAAGKDGGLKLTAYNVTAPLDEDATPVTDAPDRMVAARG
jgi:ribonuclease H / adenosylcobalamin/alpha-ribazole phosphatase